MLNHKQSILFTETSRRNYRIMRSIIIGLGIVLMLSEAQIIACENNEPDQEIFNNQGSADSKNKKRKIKEDQKLDDWLPEGLEPLFDLDSLFDMDNFSTAPSFCNPFENEDTDYGDLFGFLDEATLLKDHIQNFVRRNGTDLSKFYTPKTYPSTTVKLRLEKWPGLEDDLKRLNRKRLTQERQKKFSKRSNFSKSFTD